MQKIAPAGPCKTLVQRALTSSRIWPDNPGFHCDQHGHYTYRRTLGLIAQRVHSFQLLQAREKFVFQPFLKFSS